LLKWLWQLVLSLFWLLVKTIELVAWLLGGVRRRWRRYRRAIARRGWHYAIIFPLQQLGRGIWSAIVALFWLLIRLIELAVWVMSHLPQRQPNTAEAQLPPDRTSTRPRLLRRLRSLFRRQPLTFGLVLVLLAGFSGIVVGALVPVVHPFEGRAIVEQLTFTSSRSQRLLHVVRGVREFQVSGLPNLTLSGEFESENIPELADLDTLQLERSDNFTSLSISPLNADEDSELEIRSLQLPRQTTVGNLGYDRLRERLSFALQPDSDPDASQHPGIAELSLGTQPLQVMVEGYTIANADSDETRFELTYVPATTELILPLPEATQWLISLPQGDRADAENWFWGNFTVENVQFSRPRQSGNVADEFKLSTILSGRVRMAERSRDLEEAQFLTLTGAGIQRLRYIQIHREAPAGLQVRFSGRARKLEIGIDPKLPVTELQASWLAQYLPRDAIVATIPACAAIISYLLYWIVEQLSKPRSGNREQR
jgi:hypothetical protein